MVDRKGMTAKPLCPVLLGALVVLLSSPLCPSVFSVVDLPLRSYPTMELNLSMRWVFSGRAS
jgi:hypothetical protein